MKDKITSLITNEARGLIDEVFNLTVPPGALVSTRVRLANDRLIECTVLAQQATSEEERQEYLQMAGSYAREMAHHADFSRIESESARIEEQKQQFMTRATAFAAKMVPIILAAI